MRVERESFYTVGPYIGYHTVQGDLKVPDTFVIPPKSFGLQKKY
jgi:hypothetical protein